MALGTEEFGFCMLIVTHVAVQVSPVMGRIMRICFDHPEIFRAPYEFLFIMTGDTLGLFHRLGRILITMTVAACNATELVGMAQGQLVCKRNLFVLVTHPAFI
jgi:hypothetical protein